MSGGASWEAITSVILADGHLAVTDCAPTSAHTGRFGLRTHRALVAAFAPLRIVVASVDAENVYDV